MNIIKKAIEKKFKAEVKETKEGYVFISDNKKYLIKTNELKNNKYLLNIYEITISKMLIESTVYIVENIGSLVNRFLLKNEKIEQFPHNYIFYDDVEIELS